MRIETQCVQAGYQPENGQPRILPIYQSTTYKYDSAEHLGKLFDLSVPGHMYTRISNPTVEMVENKIAALEGGVGAMLTSSGQAANLLAVLNIASAGDNIVCASAIYGGTINLFGFTLKRLGIEARFFTPEATDEEISALFDERTRLVFGETVANPALIVCDIERLARIAHAHSVPLVIDNTFPTPVLCRPIEFGCDIVVHSTTKYMDGHASVVGGCIVDSGNFDWEKTGKYPELTEPDESYHGVVYTKSFGRAAYINKARAQLMRDFGCTPQPIAAFILNLGLESLAVRMERHCENAQAVAEYLEKASQGFLGQFPRPCLLAPARAGAEVPAQGRVRRDLLWRQGRARGGHEVHGQPAPCADRRPCGRRAHQRFAPASTTHRQLTDEQLVDAGISADLVRLSVGIENIEDILEDLEQAFKKI